MTRELHRDYTTRPGSTAYVLHVQVLDEPDSIIGVLVDVTAEAAGEVARQLAEERAEAGVPLGDYPVVVSEVPVHGEPMPGVGEVITGAQLDGLGAGTVLQECDPNATHVWMRLTGGRWAYSGASAEQHAGAYDSGSDGAPSPGNRWRIVRLPES